MATERQIKIAKKKIAQQLDSVARELKESPPEYRPSVHRDAENWLTEHKSLLDIISSSTHGNENKKNRKDQKKYKKTARPSEATSLRLISKRGTRVTEPTACYECKKKRSPTWFYRESTKGSVHICGTCKSELFNRSFGAIDALDRSVSGGVFESNRRRH